MVGLHSIARGIAATLALAAGAAATANVAAAGEGAAKWSGPYAGLTLGYGWGDSRFNDGVDSNPFDTHGAFLGGTIGYNFPVAQHWVLGAEGDISGSQVSGSFGPGNLGQPDGSYWGCSSGVCRTKVDWFGTVRARAGYTFERSLVYATGGLAVGGVKSGIDNSTSYQSSDTNTGWAAGGGYERDFGNAWSGKVEYLHVDLGWTGVSNGFFKSDAKFDAIRVGLNYHFKL